MQFGISKKIPVVLLFFSHHLFAQNYEPVRILSGHEGGITVMTKDPGRKYLIAGDNKGYLYFHNLETGEPVKKVKAHGNEVDQLQFNSNGKLLISATYDGEIKIFDFKRDSIIQGIYSQEYSGIHFVLFSIADGFIYFNGNKKLFKTRSDLTQSVFEILNEKDTITDAVITSDRSSLIFSTGSKLKVLNTRTDQIREEFNTGSSPVNKIALVNDTLLATWSVDGSIYFWQYQFGNINPIPRFYLKAGNPTEMDFSDDGTLMTSGNIGHWARIWKPMERVILQELFKHTNTVTSTCFGVNNKMIYTGGLDGNIILWKKDSLPPPPSPPSPLKDSTPVVIKQEPVTPVIKNDIPVKKDFIISESNIPQIISGRKVISNQKIYINSSSLTIYVYDNSAIDGDTMSLFFNGEWVLDHYGVTKKKRQLKLNLVPNTNNYLVMFANNLGRNPPNTAAIEFNDGKTKRFFRLSSDLKKCSAINFYYVK